MVITYLQAEFCSSEMKNFDLKFASNFVYTRRCEYNKIQAIWSGRRVSVGSRTGYQEPRPFMKTGIDEHEQNVSLVRGLSPQTQLRNLLKKSRDGKSDPGIRNNRYSSLPWTDTEFDIFGSLNLYQKIAAGRIGITQLRRLSINWTCVIKY